MAAGLDEVLGVARNASQDEIKRAYRTLARQYHPDANPDPAAEDRFKQIGAAYEVLSDPARRERYDMFGDGAAAGGFAGFGDLGDIMESFFGTAFGGGRTRQRAGGPARGADLSLHLELDFEEAVFGVTRTVTIGILGSCERCTGSGCEPGTFRTRCSRCAGTGEQRTVQRSIFGTMMSSRPCAACDGAGEVPASPCTECRGGGRVSRDSSISIEVPPGIEDGYTLRLSGRGEAGTRGGPAGDLYAQVSVKPHRVFSRDGAHLLCSLTIPVTVAALGAEVPIETLEGEETVHVSAGTQPGTLLRLKGKGVPRLGGRGRGDLVVQLLVDVPTRLSHEEKDLLDKLAKMRGERAGNATGILDRIKDALRQPR